MAATITLQNTVNWSIPFVGFAPITIGPSNEPSITNANIIAQTIMGPPFSWPWNRQKASFIVNTAVQDTVVTGLTGLTGEGIGWFEVFSVQPAGTITNTALINNVATYTAINVFQAGKLVTVTGTTNGAGIFNITNQPIISATASQFTVAITNANVASAADSGTAVSGTPFALENKNEALSEGTELDRPQFISWQVDNAAGKITFRVLPIPDQTYQIVSTFQQAPALFANLAQTWGIPDYLQYIYSYGFLFLTLDYYNMEQKAQKYRQLFVASLLARAEGLDQTDKSLWLGNYLPLLRQQEEQQLSTRLGAQGRSV